MMNEITYLENKLHDYRAHEKKKKKKKNKGEETEKRDISSSSVARGCVRKCVSEEHVTWELGTS